MSPRWRSLVARLHRWAGWGVGLILAVVGLTGSLLVFYVEIDRHLVPPPLTAGLDLDTDQVVAGLRQLPGSGGQAWRVELPLVVGTAVTARFMRPRTETGRDFAPLLATLDPVQGRPLAVRGWGETLATWIYDLHYTLLAGATGRTLLAVLGLLTLILLASGIYLWWPSPGRRLAALTRLRLKGSPARRLYDLHVLAGLYGTLVLVPLVVTGVVLERPDWLTPLLGEAMAEPDPPAATGIRIPASVALATAQAVFPQAEPRWIDIPPVTGGTYKVRLAQPGEPGRRFPKTMVWVDAATGAVVATHDWRSAPWGETVMGWMHPLHNGEALGLGGRLAALGGGLLPLVLLVTGLLRQRTKRQARHQGATRHGLTATIGPSNHTAVPTPGAASVRRD